jgi:hypothetical protein
MVTAFYLWVAIIVAPTNAYGTIAIQMVLYGTGMGLTSAPATEAIMGVVPREKAGVGSAVNDTTRLLGGTLGVAVIGSVYASIYATHLTSSLPRHLPRALAALAHSSVGAAFGVAQRLAASGHGDFARGVQHAASGAFIKGLSAGCLVAALLAAVGAVAAAALLPAQPITLEDGAESPLTGPLTTQAG